MLAITRKLNEKIHINDEIIIQVLEIRSKNVKIGINAPSHFLIFRGELYDKILDTNKEMVAANITNDDVQTFLGSNSKPNNKKEE
ncbi:carbon storage regulator [bacterium K02(2017)]|nr:carbon storage regulator [bacterium K02(2017)]